MDVKNTAGQPAEATRANIAPLAASHHWPKLAPFPVRKPELVFADTPRYWFGDNPVLTRHMDALSSLFPDGERFFVDAVRDFQQALADTPALRQEVRAFIGQEARHSEQHMHYNAGAGEAVEWSRQRCERLTRFARKHLPPKACLAVTICAEHFTATMGEHLLRREDIHGLHRDPEAQRMWLWHAIEETEHKATAFDVWRHVGGSEAARMAHMLPVTAVLLGYLIIPATVELTRRDGQLFNLRAWGEAARVLLHPRRGYYTGLLRDYFAWFKPGFHPNDSDTRSLLASWRARLGFEGGDAPATH